MFRATARFATQLCVRARIHPDAISYASIVMSASAAICFFFAQRHPLLLIFAPLFCLARLWCNMLDGMVALASQTASERGEILNDLPDRISDVLIFAGVAHSGLTNPFLAYWCALLSLLTAYVGLFGQALGGAREFGGVMSKPWRMVVLLVGAWMTFLFWREGNGGMHLGPLTILDCTCLVVIAGCAQTIALRLRKILAALRRKSSV